MKPIQKEAADLKPKHDRLKVVLLDEVDKLIDAIEKKKPVSEIGQKVPEPITRELKSFHSSLSKVGKNMEKVRVLLRIKIQWFYFDRICVLTFPKSIFLLKWTTISSRK